MAAHSFWLPLIVKMAVTAAFVVAATKAAERAGALIGAMIATLPLAAGPSYVLLARDHAAHFIADGALASLTVNAANALFALVYASLAQRRSLAPSLGAALATWTAAAVLIREVPWTTPTAILFNVVVFAVCLPVGNRFRHVAMPPVVPRWYDVPLRAAMVALLVAVVIGSSRQVGPAVTGILAVFPIVLTSLMLILHPRIGGPATAAIIAHTILGLIGFSLCCLTARLAIVPLGPALGLSLALAVSIAVNIGFWALRRRSIAAVRK
jgi:hypothetical protein